MNLGVLDYGAGNLRSVLNAFVAIGTEAKLVTEPAGFDAIKPPMLTLEAAVDVLLEPAKKVAKAFNYADRVNGRRSIFVAPDEFANGKVRMKDLRSANPEGEKEVDLNIAMLVEELQQRGIMPSTKPFGIKDSTEQVQLA